jgi:signal transduction histidine kinase
LFRGERQELEEVLGNLIDNACKYGRGQVRVTIAHAAPRDGDPYLELSVEDDGDGIPEAAREKLFTRGARVDESIPGAGLGLAIVRDIAELGGGEVTMAASKTLGGLYVRVILPAVEAA